jgi:hypothetical protein
LKNADISGEHTENDDERVNIGEKKTHLHGSDQGVTKSAKEWLENSTDLLETVRIGHLATIAHREPPIRRRAGWDPRRIGVFSLEADEWRDRIARGVDTFDCSYPFLSTSDNLGG